MLTAVFFTLILLTLLVVLSGFSEAAHYIFSFLSRRHAARRQPRPHFVRRSSLKSLQTKALSPGL